jgi:serine/threonine protein kinase
VAIKFLAERFRSDAGVVDRFFREAQAMAHLDHPNIVPVYSAEAPTTAPTTSTTPTSSPSTASGSR